MVDSQFENDCYRYFLKPYLESNKLYGKEVMDYTPSEYEPKKGDYGFAGPVKPFESYKPVAVSSPIAVMMKPYVASKQAYKSVEVAQTDTYSVSAVQAEPAVTKAVKFDEGKLRFDLIPPEFLEELARVYTIGAKKYGDNNYLNGGMDWSRVIAALKRHLNSWEKGEINDPVDKQEHLASVAWCAGALMMYQHHNLGKDDRVSTYLKAKK